jgi:hypothetical protein
MTWERACAVLTKYYGISPIHIAEMTVYQFAYYLDEIGYMENQSRFASSADTIMGKNQGQVPSTADIRALARQLNPNINIPR